MRSLSVALCSFIIGGLLNSAHSGPLCSLTTGSSDIYSASNGSTTATKPWSGLKGISALSLEISGGGNATGELTQKVESLLNEHGVQVVPAGALPGRSVDELQITLSRTGCKAVIARADRSPDSTVHLPIWFASLVLSKSVTMNGDEQQICEHVMTERVAKQLLADLSRANADVLTARSVNEAI